MFRPYNLTSLAAWTIGSIAGNNAAAKARRRFPRITSYKACYPPDILSFDNKLKKITKAAESIFKACSEKTLSGNGVMDMSPNVKAFAYNCWLQSQKASLRREIERLDKESYPAASIMFQDRITHLVDEFNSFANDMHQVVDAIVGPQSEKEKLHEAMAKHQRMFQVNECSFKLVGFGAGRLIIRGRCDDVA